MADITNVDTQQNNQQEWPLDPVTQGTLRRWMEDNGGFPGNPVPITKGGTGASSAASARTNLGLVIGTDVQAYNDNLDDISVLSDPGEDAVVFWDDSQGILDYFTLGTGLSTSGKVLNADAFNSMDFTAGENITANDPVRIARPDETIFSQTSTGNSSNIANNSTFASWSTKFTVDAQGAHIVSVTVQLLRVGTVVDNINILLINDSSGQPNGSIIETKSITGSTISNSVATDYTVTFNSIVNGGTYWIAVQRSGSSDATNFYQVTQKSEVANSNAKGSTNSSVWYTLDATRLYLIVTSEDTGSSGQIVKAKASNAFESKAFGIARETITSGNSGQVTFNGYISGLSGLTPGYIYYLSDSGSLTQTPGTNTIKLGFAISTSELILNIVN